jgi:hypothetical protein
MRSESRGHTRWEDTAHDGRDGHPRAVSIQPVGQMRALLKDLRKPAQQPLSENADCTRLAGREYHEGETRRAVRGRVGAIPTDAGLYAASQGIRAARLARAQGFGQERGGSSSTYGRFRHRMKIWWRRFSPGGTGWCRGCTKSSVYELLPDYQPIDRAVDTAPPFTSGTRETCPGGLRCSQASSWLVRGRRPPRSAGSRRNRPRASR